MKVNNWWRSLVLACLLVVLIGSWTTGAERIRVLLGSHMDYLMAEAELFEERYGVEVEIDLVTTTELRTKVISSFITRRSPWDAIFLTATLGKELAEKGWIINLTDKADELWGPEKLGLVLGSFEAGEYMGDTYAIPVTIGCPFLIWNKKMMEEAGLNPERPYEWHKTPGSFDEFLAYAKAMTREIDEVPHYGFVDAWGGASHSRFYFLFEVQGRGGDLFAEDGTPLLTSDECVAALQSMVDLYNAHKCIDPACTTYAWCFDSGAPFWEGTRGMIMSWPFMVGVSNDPQSSKIAGHVGWAPMPAINTSASSDGSEFLGIPAYADNARLGWQFIAFVTSKEMQKRQGTTSGWIPIWEDLLVDPEVVDNQPYAPAVLDTYRYPTKNYVTADYVEWTDILQAEILNAVLLEKTPKQALQDAEEAIIAMRAEE